jgi:hypothetical protein
MKVRKSLTYSGVVLAAVALLGLTSCEEKPTETPFPALAPTVTITGIQISGGITRVFASGDDKDGQIVKYLFKVDGQDPADTLVTPVLDANIDYASMEEQHTVSVVAVDNDDLKSEAAQLKFTPNLVGAANKAPDTDILSPESGATTSGGVVVEWSGRDPDGSLSGYQIRFDDGDWVSLDVAVQSYQKVGLASGSHTVQVRSKDNFNVLDPTPAAVSFVVGSGLQPELATTGVTDNATFFVPAGGTASLTVGWEANAEFYNGAIAKYSYSLDGATATETQDVNHTFDGLGEGSYSVAVSAVDLAGNSTTTTISFIVTVPTLANEVLVVQGVDWGTYEDDMANTYPLYFGSDNADVWDYWEIMSGAPDYAAFGMAVNHIGSGTPPGDIIGQYKCVLWMGQNYLGDLDSWNAGLMAGYVAAGGKVYFYGRRTAAFLDGTDLMDMAHVTEFLPDDGGSAATGYVPSATGTALGLQGAAILSTSWGNGIVSIEDSPDVDVLFTDATSFEQINGIRAKSTSGGDWDIVIVSGRNYVADPPAAMATNIHTILRDVLGIDPPGSF